MRKRRIIGLVLVSILVGLGVATYFKLFYWPEEPTFTPPIVDDSGRIIPGSVATLEQVELNGVRQWILIRGHDRSKPVILFLHGGPGAANMVWRELFVTEELERNFVVVLWDQRGAGKSFSPDLDENQMRADRFVADTISLTNHLRDRFGQEKILLIGHSWGSALGFLTMMSHVSYQQLFHAYISVGEAVDWNRRQRLSYQWTLERALGAGDQKAVKALQKLEPFDPTNREHLNTKNRWLSEFGGEYDLRNQELADHYEEYLIRGGGPEYSRADARRWIRGIGWSEKTAGTEAAESGYNLLRDLPQVRIPLFFFAGRSDYQTPSSLAWEYYQAVDAPRKEFIWFERSAHLALFEEPDKVATELRRIAAEVR
jgi:pimeloyl-ACP methyl ester carboxylesterase